MLKEHIHHHPRRGNYFWQPTMTLYWPFTYSSYWHTAVVLIHCYYHIIYGLYNIPTPSRTVSSSSVTLIVLPGSEQALHRISLITSYSALSSNPLLTLPLQLPGIYTYLRITITNFTFPCSMSHLIHANISSIPITDCFISSDVCTVISSCFIGAPEFQYFQEIS